MSDTSSGNDPFSLWVSGSEPVRELQKYVESVTSKDSGCFIPEEDRIAVFDMDGTILSENNPGDIEWVMYLRRVLNDPSYTPSEEQKRMAEEMIEAIRTGVKKPGFTERKNNCNAKAFSGMTVSEYRQYVERFLSGPSGTFEGAARKNLFYLPMVQIIEYLKSKGFTVFVCSATESLNVRTTLSGAVDIPPNQIIGTDYLLVASRQGEKDGLDYILGKDEELVYTDKVLMVASGLNKVVKLIQSIGKRPVLAFGNGTGDYSMLTFVSENPEYRSMSFMLLADDSVRDYGNPERTVPLRKHAEEMGWPVISVKNDFRTIYGNGIKPRYKDISGFFSEVLDGRYAG